MSSNYVDASHPAPLLSGASYNARGQMLADTLGNSVPEQWAYDGNPDVDGPGRGRLTQISAGASGAVYSESLSYEADGDVHSVNDSVNGAWTYQYDPMNRLAQANCVSGVGGGCDGVPNGNGLAFVYDRFGNMWQTNYVNGGQAGAQLTFAGGTNRIDGGSYNPEGDLESDGVHSYAYDAEGRLENVDGGATASYSYFPSGQRATKTTGGNTFWYLYDAQGRQLAELNASGAWERGEFYAAGMHIGSYDMGATPMTFFDTSDYQGTVRIQSDAWFWPCTAYGNWPYGDNPQAWSIPSQCQGSDDSPMHFTGQPRDGESGLDYFGARYSSSNFGRFLTPDPTGGHIVDPQSLNRYVYALDNPVSLTDPTGLDVWLQGCGKNSSTCQNNYLGTTDKQGHFHRTHLKGDLRKSVTLGRHGISVNYKGHTYSATWDTNKGENSSVTVSGRGALSGFAARITGNCGGTCVASGRLFAGNMQSPTNLSFGVFNSLNGAKGWTRNPGWEGPLDFFHPGAINFHGYASNDPESLPSMHVPLVVSPGATVPWHIDNRYAWKDLAGFAEHTGSAIHSLFNALLGGGGQ